MSRPYTCTPSFAFVCEAPGAGPRASSPTRSKYQPRPWTARSLTTPPHWIWRLAAERRPGGHPAARSAATLPWRTAPRVRRHAGGLRRLLVDGPASGSCACSHYAKGRKESVVPALQGLSASRTLAGRGWESLCRPQRFAISHTAEIRTREGHLDCQSRTPRSDPAMKLNVPPKAVSPARGTIILVTISDVPNIVKISEPRKMTNVEISHVEISLPWGGVCIPSCPAVRSTYRLYPFKRTNAPPNIT